MTDDLQFTPSHSREVPTYRNFSANIDSDEGVVRTAIEKYREDLLSKKSPRNLMEPAAIFVALLTALLTADFQDKVFSSHTWEAVFVILTLFSVGWFAYELVGWRRQKEPMTLDEVMNQIKGIH